MKARFTSTISILLITLFFSQNINAQLANGATAPDWTFTDINGTSHNLYTYLDQGMNVVLDMSATWCPPCWNYHNTHVLEDLWQARGPNGTGDIMVFHVEADPSTNQQCIYGQTGCNSTSLGDWTAGVTYPILNLNSTDASWMNNNYNINFFPTLYNICPDRRVWEVGQPAQQTWENWVISCTLEATGMVTANENCFGDNTGAISASSTGGYISSTYLWSNGSTDPNLSGIGAGTYTCTVTEFQGYFVEVGPFTVTGPSAPISIGVTNQSNINCFGNINGSVTTNITGGTPGYQYLWSNGSTQPNLSGVGSGTYTLNVTDNNGCIETQSYTITEPPLLTLTASPVPASCGEDNGIIVLDALGGTPGTSGYIYDIGNGPSSSNQFFNLPPGAYNATVTDANGCSQTTFVALTFIPPPVADAGPNLSLDCVMPQTTIAGSNSSTGNNIVYTWTTATGNIVSGGNTPNPVVDATGLYSLIVTDIASGCFATDEVIVLGNTTPPNADAGAGSELNCITSSVILDGTNSSAGNSFSYQWTTPNGNIISGANSLTPQVNAAGTYSLLVTNSINQCTAISSVEILVNTTNPTANATSSGNIDCNNALVTIDGSASSGGNLSYEWFDGSNNSIGTLPTINAATGGTYTLMVTNVDNGCTDNTSVTVTENINVPLSIANVSNNINCNNTTATLNSNGSSSGGNISYEWTDDNGTNIGSSNSVDVNSGGVYNLTVTNTDNGCTAVSSITVSENNNTPSASIASPSALTCTVSSITLDGSNSSSGNNIAYEWTDANGNSLGTESTLTVSNSGDYNLIVTDTQNGCSSSTQATVTANNTIPNSIIANSGTLTCQVNSITLDGSASSSGNNISYNWVDGSGNSLGTNNTLDVSSAGTYELVVTDNDNGCISSSITTVDQNSNIPTATASTSGSITCSNNTITLDGNGSSSGNNISYEWTDANGTNIGSSISVQVTSAGNYSLTVFDIDNGCTSSTNVIVSQNTDAPVAQVTGIGQLNCVTNAITLDGSNSSGNNIAFAWQDATGTNIGNNTTITVSSAGTYTLIVTNPDNGCTDQMSATITGNSEVPTASIASGGELTCVTNSVTLDGSASSSGNNYSYSWMDANGNVLGTNNTLDIAVAGTYELIVTNDDNGCTATSSAIVTQSATLPTVNATSSGILTCNNTVVTLDGNTSSSGNNFSYEWTDVNGNSLSTNASTNVSEPGLYNFIVTNNDNGCQAQTSVTVGIDSDEPTASITADGNLTCNNNSIVLDGSSSSGNIVSYQWLDANGNSLSTNNNVVVSSAGNYELIVTNGNNGCTSSTTYDVSEDTAEPISNAGFGGQLDCITSIVTLDGGASSIGSNYSYEWIDANGLVFSTALVVEVAATGIYNFIVTNDDNGCTATSSTEVVINISDPMANAGTGSQLDCINPSVILDGTASVTGSNYTYTWTDPNGNTIATDITAQATVSGIYTLMVTDNNNGCTGTDQVEILASNDLPTVVVASSNELNCIELSAQLSGQGSSEGPNITYQWIDITGAVIGTDLNIEVSNVGTYTLVINNIANGCSSSSEIYVSENTELPMVDANTLSALDCNNSSAVIDGTGSASGNQYTYQWLDANGNVISTDLATEVNAVGTYSLQITNTETGCSNIASTEVTEDIDTPTSNAGIGGTLNCTTTSLILDGSNSSTGGQFIYSWSTINGNISAGENTLNPTIDVAGVYTLLVTNTSNGCTANSDVVVDQTSTMDISLANQTDVSCFGNMDGSAMINVSGGAGNYSYEWSNGSTTNMIESVPAGNYNVIVTDDDNCSTAYEVTIDEPSELIPNITSINASCNGINDGQATAIVTGANTPTYLWSNGMTTSTVTELNAGIYTVTLSDNNNCPIVQEVTITEPTAIEGTIIEVVHVDCANSTTGSVTVDAQGGVGTLTYLWSIGINTPTASNLSAGTYTVSITDQNFCTNTLEVEIEANDTEMPIAMAQSMTISLDENGNGFADPLVIGEASSDNCEIANILLDISNFDCSHLGENTVTLTVIDGAGNMSTTTSIITVVDVTAPTIESCPENFISNSCNGVVYDLPTAIDNCLVPAPMLVSGLASGEVFPEGTTEVVYMFADQSGNEVMCSFTVTVEYNLDLLVDGVTNATDGQSNGSVDVSISGGTMPYIFEWTSNGALVSNEEDLTDVPPGDYELQVTDATGCIIASSTITIDNMVGNENVLLDNFIKVNPNPTSGMIFVNIDLPQNSKVQLQVFDITGRSMMTVPSQNITQQLLELDLSSWSSGVYILKVKVDDGVLAKRLILQK